MKGGQEGMIIMNRQLHGCRFEISQQLLPKNIGGFEFDTRSTKNEEFSKLASFCNP